MLTGMVEGWTNGQAQVFQLTSGLAINALMLYVLNFRGKSHKNKLILLLPLLNGTGSGHYGFILQSQSHCY